MDAMRDMKDVVGMIKFVVFITVLMICAQTAHADYMLQFKDKTANVWAVYYAKGKEYCTKKEFGEYCVQKSDVVSIKEVSAGTEASEYGITTSGGDPEMLEQRREENRAALMSLNCTQLKASNTKASKAQYRNECFTPEEKKVWNEKVQSDEERKRERLRDFQAQQRELERDRRDSKRDSDQRWKDLDREMKDSDRDRQQKWKNSERDRQQKWKDDEQARKDRERDNKIDRIDQTLRGW